MKNILIFLLFLGISVSYAQDKKPERLIQLSGVLVSADSLDQVSYASVMNKTTRTGTISDYYGYFSFVTRPGDTIIFNAFGFKTGSYIVPDTLSEIRYSMIHIMIPDTLILPEVDVYPWPSREAFAKAFVEMDPYDDAIRRAQRQLSGESLASIASRLPTDGKLAYNWQAQQNQTMIYTRGQTPINNLLNPYAWAKFVQSWRDGEFQRESGK